MRAAPHAAHLESMSQPRPARADAAQRPGSERPEDVTEAEALVEAFVDELESHHLTVGVGLCCGQWHQQMGGGESTKTPIQHLAEALAARVLRPQSADGSTSDQD